MYANHSVIVGVGTSDGKKREKEELKGVEY